MNNFRTIAVVFLAALLSASAPSSHLNAASDAWQSFLDEGTRGKGYIASYRDGAFRVTIPPYSIGKDTEFSLQEYVGDVSEFQSNLPKGYEIISPVYQYDFSDLTRSDVKKALRVSIRASTQDGNIAFFDRTKKTWNILSTQMSGENLFHAWVGMPFLHVAVIREKPWKTDSHIIAARIPARAIYVIDDYGKRYVAKAIHQQLPIASLTKLMTALVFLEKNPGWDTLITIRASDHEDTSVVPFREGEKVTTRNLFTSMLVGSKNNAANALARATGLSKREFVERMNAKAMRLGMHRTHFVDVTGLNAGNVSSAADIAILARTAFDQKDIRNAAARGRYSFQAANTRRWYAVRTTNVLATQLTGIVAAKTGYIEESGYNFVLETTLKDRHLFVIIFGAYDSDSRFSIAKTLVEFVRDSRK